MNLPARSVLSCRLYPNRSGQKFTVEEGGAPHVYKNAGHDFRFCFFRTDTELYVPSNVTAVKLQVKTAGNPADPALISITVTAASFNLGCTLDDWKAGINQHVSVSVKGTHTAALSAGTFDLTIWGFTDDDGTDADVFGEADLKCTDRGITVAAPESVPGTVYVTSDMLDGRLGKYIRQGVNDPGVWFSLQSANGTHRWNFVMGDEGVPSYDFT